MSTPGVLPLSSGAVFECPNCGQIREMFIAVDPTAWPTLTCPVACAECFKTAGQIQ